MRRFHFIERLSQTVNHWTEHCLFALGFSMALIVAIQVFCRYALNHSLFWSEELARYLLTWMTFLGICTAYRRKAHPGIDALVGRLPPKGRKICALISNAAAFCVFGVMVVYGIQFAWFVRRQISPALSLPKWLVLGIIPLSGLILIIHAVAMLTSEQGEDR